MDANRPKNRHMPLTQNLSRRNTENKKNRFTTPDPTKMGLDMPEWLSPGPVVDTPHAVPSPALPTDLSASLPPLATESTPPLSARGQTRTILEGMKVVCICKGIRTSTFWKVLDKGACTKEEVNCLTGAGSGGCQGRRCGPRIIDMLRDFLGSS